MSSKVNKAAAVRKYQAEHPNAKAREVAKAIGCDITYVYLVNSNDRKKKKPVKTEVADATFEVTRGQEVLRQELVKKDKEIEEKNRLLAGMEKLLQEESDHNHKLRNEVGRLNIVIQWMEGRLRGTSI